MAVKLFRSLFLDHPRSVGESYAEHMGVAARVGFTMIGGGLACLVHAVIPAFCVKTGSRTIARLHRRVVTHRVAPDRDPLGHRFQDYGLGI